MGPLVFAPEPDLGTYGKGVADALLGTAVLSCLWVPVVRGLQPRLHGRCALLESLIISLVYRPGVAPMPFVRRVQWVGLDERKL